MMNDAQRFQRLAGVTTLLSLLPALGADLCLGAAANFDIARMGSPGALLTIGANGANLFRWGMVLDAFGYYLLLAPLALFLWSWLRVTSPLFVTLYTLCGLGYILVGATGAIILAAVAPPLMVQYAQASAAQRDTLQIVFNSFLNAVYLGLWNPLEALLGGIWWVGIGARMRRERRALGIVTMLLGLGALLDAFGQLIGVDAVFMLGVIWLVLFFFVWVAWCGIELGRRPLVSDEVLK